MTLETIRKCLETHRSLRNDRW